MESHLASLQTKHAGLERMLHEEMSRPSPDEDVIRDLKRRKLRIKDELATH